MVTFGTNQGPIVPPSPETQQATPQKARNLVPRSPAPVSEQTEDVPNPSTYRPLVPHQYRDKLYSYTPPPSLILGTPLDRRYTPSENKYNIYEKQTRNNFGIDYTGPQFFERQPYEIYDANNKKFKTTLQPSVQYVKPHYYQQQQQVQQQQQNENQPRYVPQIGIIYSSGVRYYVPQIAYYQDEEQENSVYDQDDQKYYHREKEQ